MENTKKATKYRNYVYVYDGKFPKSMFRRRYITTFGQIALIILIILLTAFVLGFFIK